MHIYTCRVTGTYSNKLQHVFVTDATNTVCTMGFGGKCLVKEVQGLTMGSVVGKYVTGECGGEMNFM